MTQKAAGVYKMITAGFKQWKFSTNATPELSLAHRNVLDPKILPKYPYRDDALPTCEAIRKYVSKIVKHYYSKSFSQICI